MTLARAAVSTRPSIARTRATECSGFESAICPLRKTNLSVRTADPATGTLIEGDVATQTEQVFKNLGAVLRAAGKSFADVVKTTVFLENMRDFSTMNAVYGRYFEAPYPSRTTIAAAALPLGAAVEIELVAE
jgi:2-iminobutanoate/2-iminopropanoate deaminase